MKSNQIKSKRTGPSSRFFTHIVNIDKEEENNPPPKAQIVRLAGSGCLGLKPGWLDLRPSWLGPRPVVDVISVNFVVGVFVSVDVDVDAVM